MSRRCLVAVAAVSLAATTLLPVRATAAAPHRLIDVVVVLKSQANLGGVHAGTRTARLAAVEQTLRTHAGRTQRGVLGLLRTRQSQDQAADVIPLWITNEIAVHATASVVRELARRPDVLAVRPELTVQAPAATAASAAATTVEPNVALVNAPAMWTRGFRGQGVVVANMDTGVDVTHPDLAAKWRGGTDSWYDPNGQHPTTPTDISGHGTQTMGVMVGGAAGGSSIGMAPDAKWIAVKIFNDRGSATTTGIHQGFQWLLDPDQNPATPDAPDVVNDSWSMSSAACVLDFEPDLQALRTAGILPVFASGNSGPLAGTVLSPANLPEAFTVGGTDNTDALYTHSSRGPSSCAGATAPRLGAPGVGVRTSDIFGGYITDTGTSISAPHVSGSLALLLSAYPHLPVAQQETALQTGAVDLGTPGIDNDFGYGRLDVDAAYRSIAQTPDFGVSASPSSATVPPGGSSTHAVTVAGFNGFAGDVSLSLSGPPVAVGSAIVAPAVVNTAGTAQLSITTAASAPAGTYPVTVTATSGTVTHTATVALTVTGPPDFSVTATPTTQNVTGGGSANYGIAVAAVNGFAGDVSLSVSGPPASVGAASVAPAVITTAGSSQLTITTAASAVAGSYAVTVTATSGATTHSTTVTLTVTAPPDFTLGAAPASRSVSAGTATTFTASVSAVNGFTGNVALSLTGLPAAVGTATFSPAALPGSGTAQVTVSTASTAPGGTYPLTVAGTSGSLQHTVPVSLTVVALDFTLTASPTSVSVARGGTASYTISSAALGGFTGNVTLSVSGGPGGTTKTWSKNPIPTPGSATLRVRTTSSTARGTFTLTVTGKNGALTHQVTVTLKVT